MAASSGTEQRTNRVLLIGGLIVVVALGFSFISWLRSEARGYEPDCEGYVFERDEWRTHDGDHAEDDSREHQAEALAECDALVGLARAEVTTMLGPHYKRGSNSTRRKWTFGAGWVNDGFGPGDGQLLYVQFNGRGLVQRATLAYPQ